MRAQQAHLLTRTSAMYAQSLYDSRETKLALPGRGLRENGNADINADSVGPTTGMNSQGTMLLEKCAKHDAHVLGYTSC